MREMWWEICGLVDQDFAYHFPFYSLEEGILGRRTLHWPSIPKVLKLIAMPRFGGSVIYHPSIEVAARPERCVEGNYLWCCILGVSTGKSRLHIDFIGRSH